MHILEIPKRTIDAKKHGMTLPGGGRFDIVWWIENARVYIEASAFKFDFPVRQKPTDHEIIKYVRDQTS